MMKVFARRTGMLALKEERLVVAQTRGVTILEFGEPMPKEGILLADCRPKNFKGARTADDPAATAIYVGGIFDRCKAFHRFEDFGRALNKAFKLASAGA